MDYPRALRPEEWDLLDGVLPADRPGYRRVRERIREMMVLAQGRRGEGDLVLGLPGDLPDLTSPLPPVLAYGMVETIGEAFSVTVRDEVENQINIEIVSNKGAELPHHVDEKRRWTYSGWFPGQPSPSTGIPVREVSVNESLTLAFAVGEKRIWMHDKESGVVHLIPITNYYNELMLHKGIRDPKIALASSLFWTKLQEYSNADLRSAFITYNKLKHRVDIPTDPPPAGKKGIRGVLRTLFVRNH